MKNKKRANGAEVYILLYGDMSAGPETSEFPELKMIGSLEDIKEEIQEALDVGDLDEDTIINIFTLGKRFRVDIELARKVTVRPN